MRYEYLLVEVDKYGEPTGFFDTDQLSALGQLGWRIVGVLSLPLMLPTHAGVVYMEREVKDVDAGLRAAKGTPRRRSGKTELGVRPGRGEDRPTSEPL
jgi:hypothetical protein